MKRLIILSLLAFSLCPLFSFGSKEKVLTVYAYDSFAGDWGPAALLIPEFEKESGIKVNLVSAGDAVEVLSRIILEGDKTDADVVLGITEDFAHLAYPYLERYDSPVLSEIDESLIFDKEHRLLPFDYGAFGFVWDSESGIRKPESLMDLTKEEYKDQIILIDPRTSSVGLGLLYWTYNLYGDDYISWWQQALSNALTVASGWSSAYGLFTEGEAPIVLSYTTSPVYHVMNEDTYKYEAIIFPEGHEKTVEGVAVVKGTDMREEAEKFIDFILTKGQRDIAVANSMYPVRKGTELPSAYIYAPIPEILFDASALSEDLKNRILSDWENSIR